MKKKKFKRLPITDKTRKYLLKEFKDVFSVDEIASTLHYIDDKICNGTIQIPEETIAMKFWLEDLIPIEYMKLENKVTARTIALEQKAKDDRRREEERQQEEEKKRIWEIFEALPPEQQKDIDDRAFEKVKAMDLVIEAKRGNMMHRGAMSGIIKAEHLQS